jgi:hypothetical protein
MSLANRIFQDRTKGVGILGGDLADAGLMLLDPARQSLVERTVGFNTRTDNLVIGELGSNAVAIGAATLVITNAFQETNIYTALRNKEQSAIINS